MSYIVESGASSSRRARRRRTLITLAVVLLMLFFAFWYAYSYYQASLKPAAAPAPTCTTAPGVPKPGSITVNVYNATDRNGLAARTATQVRQRGFKVATIANDPLQKTVAGTAEVRYGKSAAASGKVVLALVKGARPVQDGRTDSSVDLVLGDRFSQLAPAAKPKAATTKGTTTPRPTARPSTPGLPAC